MSRLLLATRNQGKVVELRRILGEAGLDVELVGMEAYPDLPEVVESGLTFEANALLKARSAARLAGVPAIADDSGLCVDVLNGMPGIFSARWAGHGAGDRANLDLLLDQLADVPDEHLRGSFACAATVVTPDGQEQTVEGRMYGGIVREPRGSGGFGYDPIFVPEGGTLTTAEMSAAAKDAISHRGRAFRALVPVLAEVLQRSTFPPEV